MSHTSDRRWFSDKLSSFEPQITCTPPPFTLRQDVFEADPWPHQVDAFELAVETPSPGVRRGYQQAGGSSLSTQMAAISLAGKLEPAASAAVSNIQPTAAPCDAPAASKPDPRPRTAQWVSNHSQNTSPADSGEALPSLPILRL